MRRFKVELAGARRRNSDARRGQSQAARAQALQHGPDQLKQANSKRMSMSPQVLKPRAFQSHVAATLPLAASVLLGLSWDCPTIAMTGWTSGSVHARNSVPFWHPISGKST